MNSNSYNFYLTRITDFFLFSEIVCGICGNYLLFKVYSRKNLTKNSFSIYFRCMAIVDFAILLHSFTYLLGTAFDLDLHQQSDLLCKTLDLPIYILPPVSAYLLVLLSLDRLLKIKFPNRFLFFYKQKFQIASISMLFVYNVAFYCQLAWGRQLQPTIITNSTTNTSIIEFTCQDLSEAKLVYKMDLFNSAIVPFVLMTLISTSIIVIVVRSRLKINSLSSLSSSSRISTKDKKFAITTIILNLAFLVFNLPVEVLLVFGGGLEPDLYNLIYYILNTLYYWNYANDFYIQIGVNSLFRNEFLSTFGLRPNGLTQGGTMQTLSGT